MSTNTDQYHFYRSSLMEYHQLMEYLEKNKLLSDNQLGYQSKRKFQQLFLFFSIRRSSNKSLLSGIVHLDLSNPFDTLNLLEKTKSYGVDRSALIWSTEYLFQISQVVKLGQELSDPRLLTCGVSQGSILGPILLMLFFNDVEAGLSSESMNEKENNLNGDLASITTYLSCNERIIKLKKSKTECMLLVTSKRIATAQPDSRDLQPVLKLCKEKLYLVI